MHGARQHRLLLRYRSGFLLLEALVAIVVFALILGAISVALFIGQEGVLRSGDRIRGVFLSERALQAARSLRDRDFSLLVPGQHGLCIDATGFWSLCGEQSTDGEYSTTMTITALTADRVQVVANTYWGISRSRTGSVVLSQELTDWRKVKLIGDWSTLRLKGAAVVTGTPLYRSIALSGTYAFVTSDEGNGGNGLAVFSIAGDAAPVRQASSFDLGFPGYGISADSTHLFVVTGDPGAEVQIFDLSNPAAFSMSMRVGTINIPGTSRARSIALFGKKLFIGAIDDPSEAQLYAYDITDVTNPVLLGSLSDPGGSYSSLSLHDGYAYVASSATSMELKVIDVFDPAHMSVTGGYNLTDVQEGLSVGTVASSVLLGRSNGAVIEELVLFDLSNGPVPLPPPGPWYREMGGGVTGISMEPGGTYAFLSTDNLAGQLQVVDLAKFAAGQFPIIATYQSTTGAGHGVFYDPEKDRVLLATDRALLLFAPGS